MLVTVNEQSYQINNICIDAIEVIIGGILSPLVFVIYVSDLSRWLKHSVVGTYADDTQSSVSGNLISEIKRKLEEDGNQVLKFMASNRLIANPKKTALIVLNHKLEIGNELSITIGKESITQVKCAKLLGITFEANLKWSEHIYGTGGLISCLNQRLFFIRRLKNTIGQKALLKISDGLFSSKIRYGLQLLGCVRWRDSDPSNKDLEAIQKCQNKLLRVLNGTRISDKVSTISMLVKFKTLSVNQMNAQVKLNEMWKTIHIEKYPIKTVQITTNAVNMNTRARSAGLLFMPKVTCLSERTFINDAIHIWNQVPNEIKECTTLHSAKKAIKSFVATLPI